MRIEDLTKDITLKITSYKDLYILYYIGMDYSI
ncbi:hypothetical protein M670_00235 [Schinkia azotoformans MEV2011]|uniref:Uncharacterized protein n=1 Tax=Schinkia azotoformans MEV2011 TaxID=1348973 RepID=A0A072P421_SCHAZ|nr:hypothetical protein M670_00235 [Schinkia azotoformans MEV2011]